jgi:hypothetical protein
MFGEHGYFLSANPNVTFVRPGAAIAAAAAFEMQSAGVPTIFYFTKHKTLSIKV